MAAGRPRAFETQQALDRALKVFLRKGYEGASLTDLTRSMRINAPSLYAAFGNKEQLFRHALDRYQEERAQFLRDSLESATAREVVEKLLRGSVERQTSGNRAPGCLSVHGALSSSTSADPIRLELNRRRRAAELTLRARLERARVAGDLPRTCSPQALALYVTSIINGMAVQAAGGATREELNTVVDLAMQIFPTARGVGA